MIIIIIFEIHELKIHWRVGTYHADCGYYDMHRMSHFDKSYNVSVTSRVADPQREAGYRIPSSDYIIQQ